MPIFSSAQIRSEKILVRGFLDEFREHTRIIDADSREFLNYSQFMALLKAFLLINTKPKSS